MHDFLARIKENATKPSGSMPTRAPKVVMASVLVLVACVVTFCGRPPASQRAARAESRLPSTGIDDARVQQVVNDLKKREQELRDKLNAIRSATEPTGNVLDEPLQYYARPPVTAPAARDESRERAERERQERRASNVVFSSRQQLVKASDTRPAGPPLPAETPKQETAKLGPAPGEQTLYEGTLIEASLTNRLNGSFTGPVNCIVSGPVYSADRQDLLIPQGSRLLGSAHRVSGFGQERLAITFHRLILPNGRSITLGDEIGLNAIGEPGLKDKTDHHLFRLLATSAAVGILGGTAMAGTNYGLYTTGEDRILQTTVGATAGSITRILDRFLNVLPTVTIREGHRVRVYLARDMFLPPYQTADEVAGL
jgi:type IV secretion system protein VirB10